MTPHHHGPREISQDYEALFVEPLGLRALDGVRAPARDAVAALQA